MKKSSSGFTIVELIIVITVIAILAAITVVAYNNIQKNAAISAMRSEVVDLGKQIDVFQTQRSNVFPTSITDCPDPSAANMCLPPSKNGDLYYAPIPSTAGGSRKVELPSFELGILGEKNFYYHSKAEITSGNEFMRYADLAPIIDKYGLVPYELSFDIKSASPPSNGVMRAYMQNGSGTRYYFGINVPVTANYTRQTITFTPNLSNSSLSESWLAFYGTYHTGNIPSVKNLELTLK